MYKQVTFLQLLRPTSYNRRRHVCVTSAFCSFQFSHILNLFWKSVIQLPLSIQFKNASTMFDQSFCTQSSAVSFRKSFIIIVVYEAHTNIHTVTCIVDKVTDDSVLLLLLLSSQWLSLLLFYFCIWLLQCKQLLNFSIFMHCFLLILSFDLFTSTFVIGCLPFVFFAYYFCFIFSSYFSISTFLMLTKYTNIN